jgi:hypothetical protein
MLFRRELTSARIGCTVDATGQERTMTNLNAKQAPSEMRALEEAEMAAVSGAKFETYDFGVLGMLWLGEGCAVWSMTSKDDQGYFSTQQSGYCPPN